jgi:hypothetical protein
MLPFLPFLGACVDLSTICPYKPITQGVFGEIVDANNKLEENVPVDAYTILNGVKDTLIATHATTRGGYQFNLLPSQYMLCAKTVCTMVTVPTGLVEVSAVDAAAGLTWDAPVGVPPEQMIGACKYGS